MLAIRITSAPSKDQNKVANEHAVADAPFPCPTRSRAGVGLLHARACKITFSHAPRFVWGFWFWGVPCTPRLAAMRAETRRDEARRGSPGSKERAMQQNMQIKSHHHARSHLAAIDSSGGRRGRRGCRGRRARRGPRQRRRCEARRCEVRLYCSLRLKKLEAETSDIARDSQAQAGAGRARALLVACRPSPANFCRT
jgi:hypothetical protein